MRPARNPSRFAAALGPLLALACALPSPVGAATVRGTVIYPPVHEDVDPRPEARKPLGAWRLENGRKRIAAEADVRRDVVLALEPLQPAVVDPQPLTLEARPSGLLEPAFTLAATGVIVTWKNADQAPRVVTLEDGDTLLPPEPAAPGATREVRFTINGEYVFLDPEHPFARAMVVVTGTPYVARADDRGAFTIDAPDGKYRLRAWWRGKWSEGTPIELSATRGREPVTVRLASDGGTRIETRVEPPPPNPLAPPPGTALPGAAGAPGTSAAAPGAPRPPGAPPRPVGAPPVGGARPAGAANPGAPRPAAAPGAATTPRPPGAGPVPRPNALAGAAARPAPARPVDKMVPEKSR